MKTDGVNQLPDFHVRDGSSVYWQVKHVLVRHILRVNIVEGRSKPNKETNWCTANMLHSQ